jgi:hypothetical protein
VSDLREHPLDKTFKVWDSPVWLVFVVESFYTHDLELGGRGGVGTFKRIQPQRRLGLSVTPSLHLPVVDGGLVEVAGEDVRGNHGSSYRDLCELVHDLIVLAHDVIELEAIELVL